MIGREAVAEWSLRASRNANRITAIGALVVISAFAGGLALLFSLDREVTDKRTQLQSLVAQFQQVKQQKERLLQENSDLKRFRNALKRVNQELEDTVRLQQSRQYLKAWEKAYSILARDPENEVAHTYAAHSCFQLGRYKESMAYSLQAIAIDPTYLDPYVPLVCALIRLGDASSAVAHLNRILNESTYNYMAIISRKRYFDEIWGNRACRAALIQHQQKLQSIQERLRDLGYYTCASCKIDALFGAETEAAIEKFLVARGIAQKPTVNGLVESLRAGTTATGRPQ